MQGYPQYPAQQGFTDAAGYAMPQVRFFLSPPPHHLTLPDLVLSPFLLLPLVPHQNTGMMGYPPQGIAPQQPYQPMMGAGMAYPPMNAGAPPMGMQGTGMAAAAYPPAAAGMGMGMPMGQQAFGGGEDPYAYAQQFGLTRGEVDGALEAYTELNNTDRGLLSAFGAGTAQKVLQKVFGSAGNDQMIAVLVGVLGSALASGRMPTIKDFISMMGQYKMVRSLLSLSLSSSSH
jgi:hypothetical protein